MFFFNTEEVKIYRANYAPQNKNFHAGMAMTKDDKEFYRIGIFNKGCMKTFVTSTNSDKIQSFNKEQLLTRMREIRQKDIENNKLRFITCCYKHIGSIAYF